MINTYVHILSSAYGHDSATMMYSSRLVRLGWCYVLLWNCFADYFFLTQASLRDNFHSIVFNLYFCFVFEVSFISVSTISTTKSELFLSHPSRFSPHSSNSCRSSWDKATPKSLDEPCLIGIVLASMALLTYTTIGDNVSDSKGNCGLCKWHLIAIPLLLGLVGD